MQTTSAPKVELPPIPARLLVPTDGWIDAPDYGLTKDSTVEDIRAALIDAMNIYIENRANALACLRQNAELIGAVERRQE